MTTDNPQALDHLQEAARLARTLTHHGASAALKPRERQALTGLISALAQLRAAMTGEALPARITHTVSEVHQFAQAENRRYEGSYELGSVIGSAILGAGVYNIDADVLTGIVNRLKAEYRALGAVVKALEAHVLLLGDDLPFDTSPITQDALTRLEMLLDGARAKGHAGLRLMVTTHLGSGDEMAAAYVLDASGNVGSPYLLPREQEVWLHETLKENFAADFTYHAHGDAGGSWMVTTVGQAYDDGGAIALDDEGRHPETFGLREIFDPSPEQVEELFDEGDFTGDEDGEDSEDGNPEDGGF